MKCFFDWLRNPLIVTSGRDSYGFELLDSELVTITLKINPENFLFGYITDLVDRTTKEVNICIGPLNIELDFSPRL